MLVGNGEEIHCSMVCEKVSLTLQDHSFTVDLFILPLSGADIVLGIQWLKQLGPVLTDYSELQMKFIWDGKLIHLNAASSPVASEVSLNQLRRIATANGVSVFFHLSMIPATSDIEFDEIPGLSALTAEFQHLFDNPSGLPPSRTMDHRIHLES